MNKKQRVIIVHGWDGKPDSHWMPWLKKELETRGFEVFAPQMPGGEHPKRDEWMGVIAETVGIPDRQTYFVGHSLGCIAIVRYLEALPYDIVIGGAVFVAGFYEDLGESELLNFLGDVDFDRVTMHAKKFAAIVSRNDDQVPQDKAENFQRKLGAELILEHSAGHFTESDGVVYLEAALQEILKMSH